MVSHGVSRAAAYAVWGTRPGCVRAAQRNPTNSRAHATTAAPEAALAAVRAAIGPLDAKLLPDLRHGPDGVLPENPEALAALLDEVQQVLAARLLTGEEA